MPNIHTRAKATWYKQIRGQFLFMAKYQQLKLSTAENQP